MFSSATSFLVLSFAGATASIHMERLSALASQALQKMKRHLHGIYGVLLLFLAFKLLGMAARTPFKEAKPDTSVYRSHQGYLFLEELFSLLIAQSSSFEFFANQSHPSGAKGKKSPSFLWRCHLPRSSNDQILGGGFLFFRDLWNSFKACLAIS